MRTIEAVEEKNQFTEKSRWVILAEEIHNDPILKDPEFQKAWKKMRKDMQECREGLDL